MEELQAANDQLRASLEEAMGALKDANKHLESEQDDRVKKCIAEWVINHTFKTVKFARDEKLQKVTMQVYAGVGALLGFANISDKDSYMAPEEFARIYKCRVTFELNRRRQYVQTQMLAAFQCKSNPCVLGYLLS